MLYFSQAGVNIDRLTLEYQTASNTYTSLAGQIESTRIKIEEDKPLFVVIEPPIPLNIKRPSEPRIIIYIAISLVLGLIIGMTIVFGKTFIKRNN